MKTQEIYAILFLARYLDIFSNHLSIYLTFMKVVFVCSTFYIIYLIRYTYSKSYSKQEDTFPKPLLLLVAPCAVLAFIVTANYHITEVRLAVPPADPIHSPTCLSFPVSPLCVPSLVVMQIFWTFSILLEAVAILPQLWMLLKHGETVEVRNHFINVQFI